MATIKKFNESDDFENEDDFKIKIKHLIEYLKQFNPESEIMLDKDSWWPMGSEVETIEQSGIFDYSNGVLFINN